MMATQQRNLTVLSENLRADLHELCILAGLDVPEHLLVPLLQLAALNGSPGGVTNVLSNIVKHVDQLPKRPTAQA